MRLNSAEIRRSAKAVRLLSTLAAVVLAGPAAAHGDHPADPDLARVASFFSGAQIVEGPTKVDCTLSEGAKTTCFSITVRPDPQDYTPGPWCPTNVSQGAEAGGIWFLDGKAVDVDGDFITRLAEVYGDSKWKLYDPETGDVRYTGTLEACEAAARPDVDPQYQNHCVQCLPEYMPEDASVTYVIPLEPVPGKRQQATQRGGSGVASNGVRLDGPAPLDAILGAHTIAPFDDCGGHVNLHVGYHYHAVTDCLSPAATTLKGVDPEAAEAHGGQIGIAMDGHAIFPHMMADGTEPEGLDACYGREGEGLPYHYHVGSAGSNQILGCLAAQTGCVLPESGMVCDASRRPPRP
ncbi:YHYH protein [Roseibium sp.]|uniref:YHYH protein n=1 Tax=Roseibium sp. TaxID=1936156 RepID=UPI00326689FC